MCTLARIVSASKARFSGTAPQPVKKQAGMERGVKRIRPVFPEVGAWSLPRFRSRAEEIFFFFPPSANTDRRLIPSTFSKLPERLSTSLSRVV